MKIYTMNFELLFIKIKNIYFIHLLALRTLTSNLRLSSTVSPAQTLIRFSSIYFYLGRALITLIPSSVLGLLRRYPNHDSTVSSLLNPLLLGESRTLYSIRSKSSQSRKRSIMMGAASRESSQTL